MLPRNSSLRPHSCVFDDYVKICTEFLTLHLLWGKILKYHIRFCNYAVCQINGLSCSRPTYIRLCRQPILRIRVKSELSSSGGLRRARSRVRAASTKIFKKVYFHLYKNVRGHGLGICAGLWVKKPPNVMLFEMPARVYWRKSRFGERRIFCPLPAQEVWNFSYPLLDVSVNQTWKRWELASATFKRVWALRIWGLSPGSDQAASKKLQSSYKHEMVKM